MKVIKAMAGLIAILIVAVGLLILYGLHQNDTPVRKHSRIIKNRVKPERWTSKDDDSLIDEMDKLK